MKLGPFSAAWSVLFALATALLFGCGPAASPTGTSGSNAAAGGDGSIDVILLRYTTGSESTEQREAGFLDTMQKEFPTINILTSSEYSGTTRESSLDKAQQLFIKYGDRLDGIFAVCEPNSIGVLEGLENAGLAKKVKFIAFDPSSQLIQAMREEKIHGIVLQDPVKMGYLAVQTMVDHLEGKEVPRRIATGEYVATPENMDSTDAQGNDMRALLEPLQFSDAQAARPENPKFTIAVIPKGTTHVFWKSIHAGAERAARERGNVAIAWKGPLREDDLEGQINEVQNMITRKVDGICLAPLNAAGLVEAVKSARAAGIPVVIFDSDLADKEIYVSYVATDNYHGGVLAARRLAETLGVAPASVGKP
jgi:ABC-type sugar transport system substrate-binding protein